MLKDNKILLLFVLFSAIFAEEEIKHIKKINYTKNLNTLLYSSSYGSKYEHHFNNSEERKIPLKIQEKRKLSGEDGPIRIFVDTHYLDSQKQEGIGNIDSGIYSYFSESLTSFVPKKISQLINVTRFTGKIPSEKVDFLAFGFFPTNKINETVRNGELEGYDLIILPRFLDNTSLKSRAFPVLFDNNNTTGRPLVGIIYISPQLGKDIGTKENSFEYLNSYFLHLFTHILGFHYPTFEKFPGGFGGTVNELPIERKVGSKVTISITKKLIISQKVYNLAQKYYGCLNPKGVELENQVTDNDYDDLIDSHWDARILLGEYMNSAPYTPEQAISEFTLALLEDSGWYKVNYYTGGLMRFGKGKKCDFLQWDCVDVDNNDKPLFDNDFCDAKKAGLSGCSPGRQSLTYCKVEPLSGDNNAYKRFRYYYNKMGRVNADLCFVHDKNDEEEKNTFYAGSCRYNSQKFGSQIFYNDIGTRYNGQLPQFLGEKFSESSFCTLTTLIPSNNPDTGPFKDILRATCYEMSCSDKCVTIKLNGQYIVCPRKGGIIKVSYNYEGYVYCPDYNLICTGTVMCNNMFECIDKKSEPKNNTYDYEYAIGTHLNHYSADDRGVADNNLLENAAIEGYEESKNENGLCPENCRQCIEKRKCVKCRTNYYFTSLDELKNENITCASQRPTIGYYEKGHPDVDGEIIYYPCVPGCARCTSRDVCDECITPEYFAIGTKCALLIENCLTYNELKDYQECLVCNTAYYFLKENRTYCRNDLNTSEYYTKDGGKSYYPCTDAEKHCRTCTDESHCTSCTSGFALVKPNLCVDEILNCKDYNETTNFINCSKCKDTFYFIKDDRKNCRNDFNKNQYFTEDNISFYPCSEAIVNCSECTERTKCSKCIEGYAPVDDNKTCVHKIEHCEIYNKEENYKTCSKCVTNYYFLGYTDRTYCTANFDPTRYFRDESGFAYIPCYLGIPNCDQCDTSTYCKSCLSGYQPNDQHTICISYQQELHCKIENISLYKDIKDTSIVDLDLYIEGFKEKLREFDGTVQHFGDEKYTLTLFQSSGCTNDLLSQGYYKLDMNEITSKFNINPIFLFITHRVSNYVGLYEKDRAIAMDISDYLDTNYSIVNNFSKKIYEVMGELYGSKIIGEEIDVFSKEKDIFTNICKNFTIAGIDIPVIKRLSEIYYGDNAEGILCTDENCIIENYTIINTTGYCQCKINNNLPRLLRTRKNNSFTGTLSDFNSLSDSFKIFTCIKTGFNIKHLKANVGFFITLGALIAQILLYIFFVAFSSGISISSSSAPPPKEMLKFRAEWFTDDMPGKPGDAHDEELEIQSKDEEEDNDIISEVIDDKNKSSDSADTDVNRDKLVITDDQGERTKLKEKRTKKVLIILPDGKRSKNNDSLALDFFSFDKARKSDKRSFLSIYWQILSLKQRIINYFSCIKFFKITDSCLPIQIKLMRSLFVIVFSLFLCSLLFKQSYFVKKYEHFNDIFYLQTLNTLNFTVPYNKRFSYSMGHTYVEGLLTCLIMIVVQFIFGIVFLSVRKEVSKLLASSHVSEIEALVQKTKKKYMGMFVIFLILMLVCFFYLTNFNGVYSGSSLDYIAGGLWAIIFLQIYPFISSLVIALFRYLGILLSNKCLYDTSQFFLF